MAQFPSIVDTPTKSSIRGSVKRLAIAIPILIGVFYLAASVLLFSQQRSLLYFPTAASRQPIGTSFSLETGGETLRIWTKSADSADAVIYFGGNAEDVGLNMVSFAEILPNKNLYLVNYRGYGGSTGSPSEEALFSDALAAYDYVRARHENISVVGRSLGTGVAVYLAANRKIDHLVLVTPYDSIENVAKKHFPFFPISLLLKDKFDSASRVRSISAQTFVLLAEDDQVIPRENSIALINQIRADQVTIREIKNSNHDSIGYSTEYHNLLSKFLL